MPTFSIFDIAGSGMSAQSVRLNATASNLANADSVAATPEADLGQRPRQRWASSNDNAHQHRCNPSARCATSARPSHTKSLFVAPSPDHAALFSLAFRLRRLPPWRRIPE